MLFNKQGQQIGFNDGTTQYNADVNEVQFKRKLDVNPIRVEAREVCGCPDHKGNPMFRLEARATFKAGK